MDTGIEELRDQLDDRHRWVIGLVATMLLGFGGAIVAVLMRG